MEVCCGGRPEKQKCIIGWFILRSLALTTVWYGVGEGREAEPTGANPDQDKARHGEEDDTISKPPFGREVR